MIFRGKIPFTTIDFPDHLACVFFCGRCNMRCRFCHNPHLIFDPESEPEISEDEILDFLERRRGRIEGVVVSGGEPTVHKDLPKFLRRVKDAGFDIKLDTNGSNPAITLGLIDVGIVDAMGLDYKHLLKKYPQSTCVDSFQKEVAMMLSSIASLTIPVDVRTTVHRAIHSPDDLRSMRAELDGYGIVEWVVQQFNNVDVIDDSLNEIETYSDIELNKIVADLHDTEIRG